MADKVCEVEMILLALGVEVRALGMALALLAYVIVQFQTSWRV